MSLDEIIKRSVFEDFKKFGILMLILIPIRITAGLDFIEVYMDILLIGISLVIFYLIYDITKVIPKKRLRLFSLNLILAHILYFIVNILDSYLLNSQDSELIILFNILIIFSINLVAHLIHLYAWNTFRIFVNDSLEFFPKESGNNAISGSKNILLAIGLRIGVSLLSLFISTPFGDVFFILSMLILLLIFGSILFYTIGYVYLSMFRKIDNTLDEIM
jgi:hypothetical protein